MGRYIGPSCRRCRTLSEKLFLKGKKCYGAKCTLERRNTKPGQHGKIRRKVSEYSIQLTEKQKLKNLYGMNEKQFRQYFADAARMKGITGNNLLVLLERRLDNALLRAGLASTRNQARQLVRHGHVKVNGRSVNIPSYLINQGNKIEIKNREHSTTVVKSALEYTSGRVVPPWLKVDHEKFEAEVFTLPNVEDIDHKINVQLIVELYSK